MRAKVITTGTRYGRLVVVRDRHAGQPVHVRCDCGTELAVSLSNLSTGNSRSCGCLKCDTTIARNTKHGMAGTRIYMIWAEMLARCTRPSHPRFSWRARAHPRSEMTK